MRRARARRYVLVWVGIALIAASDPAPSASPLSFGATSDFIDGLVAALTPVANPGPTPSPAGSVPNAPTAPATTDPDPTPAPPFATPDPRPAPTGDATTRILFGLGSQAEAARIAPITAAAPIHMLSNWYSSPTDLVWMTDAFHRAIYEDAYADGFALHLITWTPEPETTFTASTGTVCGREYPLSARWLDDMRQLAEAFGGPSSGPPFYVTLFTEFQTYPCVDSAWNPNTEVNAYYRALIAQYEQGVALFHQYAPNARVSLGWGGWQADWDDSATGSGRSMIPHFATAMRDSDFVSFQAMHGVTNVTHIRAMTAALGTYRPVMLAHHMPDADTNSLATVYATFLADVTTVLTPESMADLAGDGLFAWSFLDDKPMQASATTFSIVEDGVTAFGR